MTPTTTTGPRGLDGLEPVPYGATARRLDWLLLPPTLRRLVEDQLGTRVVSADSVGAGFTPGLASVLTGADGRRVFLKAASKKAQRPFAEAYAEELRTLRKLPQGLPVPRLLWTHEDDHWVVLATEYVDGGNPSRPWRTTELDACLDTLEVLADRLTPSPMPLHTFAEDFASFYDGWAYVQATSPDWPHLQEAVMLAARYDRVTLGSGLVHTDARDDNFLMAADGRALLCDWNWPVVGAPWIDSVCLLMTAFGDGLDADAVLAARPLTRDVDPEHVDVLLALLAGYFLERRDQPAPHTSPYLRRHQDWCAEATWSWLASRRGWA